MTMLNLSLVLDATWKVVYSFGALVLLIAVVLGMVIALVWFLAALDAVWGARSSAKSHPRASISPLRTSGGVLV